MRSRTVDRGRIDPLAAVLELALDCCGREIVVPRDVASPPIPWDKRPPEDANVQDDAKHCVLLCLLYEEVGIEKSPVLYSDAACSSSRKRRTGSCATCRTSSRRR